MTLTIGYDSISGDNTSHTARRMPGHQEAWEVSWLPGRLLDRNAAITAMLLAELFGSGSRHPGDRIWPHIQGWTAEIGLTAPEAQARLADPEGGTSSETRGATQDEPEAGSWPGPATVNYADPDPRPPMDPALYERLIAEGIADADRRGRAVDHVTARRLATWLAARPQQPDPGFASALTQFTRTGTISQALKNQLRRHAYSPSYPHRSDAFRLVQYCNSRGPDRGPVTGFARDCDQIDQADAMLAGLRDRVRNGIGPPAQAFPDAEGPPVIARAERDRGSHTVSLILDETTANIAMYAIAAHAGDCEAHVREVRQFAHGLPDQSYGKRNRQAIAARETRVAQRLRAVERAYHVAAERDTAITPPAAAPRPAGHVPDREIELE